MNKQKSFTLIELLVVIVIIGILAGVIMISTSSSIDKANFAKAQAFSSTVQNELLLDLVSEWTFDSDVVGGKTEDTWGNNDGTVNGATYKMNTTKECVFGGCYSFDGNDYIDVGLNKLKYQDNFTISTWFKFNNNPNNTGTFCAARHPIVVNNDFGYNLIVREDGKFNWFVYDTSSSSKTVASINPPKLGEYHHVVGVKNEKTITMYVDGTFQGSENLINNSVYYISQPFAIGGRAICGGEYFYSTGLMDDVRIYNTALSSTRIKQNYIAGLDSLLKNRNMSKEEYNENVNTLAHEE